LLRRGGGAGRSGPHGRRGKLAGAEQDQDPWDHQAEEKAAVGHFNLLERFVFCFLLVILRYCRLKNV
jgi:hypothetical protein